MWVEAGKGHICIEHLQDLKHASFNIDIIGMAKNGKIFRYLGLNAEKTP